MNRWNQNKIIVALKETARRLNHSPSEREAGPALYQICYLYFGSFNKAKRAANLAIIPPKNKSAGALTEDLAYIFGTIKGDGHYRKRKTLERTSAEIILKVKNSDFAKEFEKKLRKWSGIQPKIGQKNGEFYVALYSVDAVNIIQKINLEKIITSNKKVKANFLKGLYDSEGGVCGTNLNRRRFACRWIYFSNSDKKIIKTVSRLLKDFKISCKIKSRIHSGFESKKRQYEILIFGLENLEKFYKNIGFSIRSKKDKLIEVIRSYEKYREKISTQSLCI